MVDDNVSPSAFGDDIDDQGTFNNALASVNTGNNYGYTELGELKKDEQEQIASIVWRTDGKIKEIIRESTSSKKNLKFEYDPMGNRIAKHVLTSANVEESVTYYVRDAQGNIMSTYVKTAPGSILSYKVEERHLYGSARLGIYGEQKEMIGATVSTTYFNHLLGKRSFEGVNHLGNVLTVFSDRKFPQNSGGSVSGFKAELFASQDYYPFGMVMPGRDFSSENYRFGFNSKEDDDEVHGDGNWQDYGMRMYDPRIARFPNVDPLTRKFPSLSTYQFAGNTPIWAVDLDGLEPAKVNDGVEHLVITNKGATNAKGQDVEVSEGNTQCKNVSTGCGNSIGTIAANPSNTQVVSFQSSNSNELTPRDIFQTIYDYRKQNEKGHVYLVGHSLGASNFREVMRWLVDAPDINTNIDLMITLDPASYAAGGSEGLELPPLVEHAINFNSDPNYNSWDLSNGKVSPEMNNTRTQHTNIVIEKTSHTTIDNTMRNTVIKILSSFAYGITSDPVEFANDIDYGNVPIVDEQNKQTKK